MKMPNKADKVACNYCKNKHYHEITHFKEHLAYVSRNLKVCALVPNDVKKGHWLC